MPRETECNRWGYVTQDPMIRIAIQEDNRAEICEARGEPVVEIDYIAIRITT